MENLQNETLCEAEFVKRFIHKINKPGTPCSNADGKPARFILQVLRETNMIDRDKDGFYTSTLEAIIKFVGKEEHNFKDCMTEFIEIFYGIIRNLASHVRSKTTKLMNSFGTEMPEILLRIVSLLREMFRLHVMVSLRMLMKSVRSDQELRKMMLVTVGRQGRRRIYALLDLDLVSPVLFHQNKQFNTLLVILLLLLLAVCAQN